MKKLTAEFRKLAYPLNADGVCEIAISGSMKTDEGIGAAYFEATDEATDHQDAPGKLVLVFEKEELGNAIDELLKWIIFAEKDGRKDITLHVAGQLFEIEDPEKEAVQMYPYSNLDFTRRDYVRMFGWRAFYREFGKLSGVRCLCYRGSE